MIYADFESILVPKDKEKLNPNESYANTYQKHVACSYGCKLVCVGDKFNKPFKSYLDKDAVYNFISSMIGESKYCTDVREKHFNKELVMAKEDTDDFNIFIKCLICDNDYIDVGIKVSDHFPITRKWKVCTNGDCNIHVVLNHKIPIVFHNLKNHDSHLTMRELSKSNLKINVTSNGFELQYQYQVKLITSSF